MIPDASDPCWRRVLLEDSDLSDALLGTKLIVTQLRRELRERPGALNSKIAELRAYVEKNGAAVKDIALF